MTVIGATEAEGGDRKREVKDMLRAALRDTHVKMVSERDYDCVGLQYTDKFASYLEVLSAMSLLPWRQRVIIVRNLGEERMLQEDIAKWLGVRRQTVSEDLNAGLDVICMRIYENSPDKPDKLTGQTGQTGHIARENVVQ